MLDKEKAKKIAALFQAFADGKELDYYSLAKKRWVPVPLPCADLMAEKPEKYRIHPETKTVYVNVYPDGTACWYTTEEIAKHASNKMHCAVAVPMTFELPTQE
ncbi:MAG: hypothetical protein KGI54_17425 [Pseudomonadota bacterium]|nr:hypothetical protein [Pseudomonadota bacterium]